jgi:hypothetical protein
MQSYSVNLTAYEWRLVKSCIAESNTELRESYIDNIENKVVEDDHHYIKHEEIMYKIDKKQRAEINLKNTITRKNKLIDKLKKDIIELQNKLKAITPH